MIPKPLERVEAADIDSLLSDKVQEGRTIEYKRDLPGGSDADRREFLADASSFANTVGGDVVFGIEEVGGLPTTIVGVRAPDIDEEIQRLDSILLSGLDPRIRYAMRPVTCSSAATTLIIRIERSWIGPHRVTLKGHDKFYARNSAGKYALDVEELRQAFVRNATFGERIRAFRADRVLEIGRDQTPVALPQGARLVLHFIPQEAFSTSRLVDVTRYFRNPNLMPPMDRSGWSHRITLEGVLTYTAPPTGAACYTHLYRTGVIEAVDAYVLNRRYENQWSIPSTIFEGRILESVGTYLNVLIDLGVAAPVYIFISLLGVKGRRMSVPAWYDAGYPIDREVVQLPETVVMEMSEPPDSIMREAINLVWNACGFAVSPNFNDQGRWQRPR